MESNKKAVIKIKILNFGSCNIDYVYMLDHIVKNGETEACGEMKVFAGGKGLNQSIAIARAEAEVYHAGCVGTDGEFLAALLAESGVDTRYLKRVDAKNGNAIIQVSREGDNSIIVYSGSNAMIEKCDVDAVLTDFCEGDILLLQNEISNLSYIIEKAYEIGMRIILNPSPINKEIFELDFSMLSYLILNETEAADLSGCDTPYESLDFFREKYPTLKIMLTLGKDGCLYQDGERRIYHPTFDVTTVDTTAAGDTFTGYFVMGVSSGLDIKQNLRLASCAAAIAVSRQGAAPSIPTIDEVRGRIDLMRARVK